MKSTRKIKNKTIKNRNKTNKIKIGGTKKQKFIKLSCSPENDKNSSSFTCYSNDDLNKLKEIWNTRHPDNTINTNDTKEIWNNLKIYYNKSCNKKNKVLFINMQVYKYVIYICLYAKNIYILYIEYTSSNNILYTEYEYIIYGILLYGI